MRAQIKLKCCLHPEMQHTGQGFWQRGYRNAVQMKETPKYDEICRSHLRG